MSNEAPSCIEDLPNELWLGIFDYLDWINLFLGFYGINKRINELLVSIKVLSLYSSYLTIHSNSIYIFFKEFPIKEFKQIQHLKLIYDSSYKDALNIAKHFSSLSSLISLTIDAKNCVDYGCGNELAMIYFRQHCPFLQRLYLYGREFDREFQLTDNMSILFSISSLHTCQ